MDSNSSISLHTLYHLLEPVISLSKSITLQQCILFIRLVARLKREILHDQQVTWNGTVPDKLPSNVIDFLAAALQCDSYVVLAFWKALGPVAWTTQQTNLDLPENHELELWKIHGHHRNLAYHNLYPPNDRCTSEKCPRQGEALLCRKDTPKKKAVYTLQGSYVAFDVHLLCQICKTNYHHNYSVSGGMRTYYGGRVPDFVQVGEHQFINRPVLNLVIGMMLTAWTSATNAARIYNECLSMNDSYTTGDDSDIGNFERLVEVNPPALRTEHIWDGFVLLSLLEDYQSRNLLLVIPHIGSQNVRFESAMRERNSYIENQGQPELAHFCDKCCRVWPGNPETGEGPKKLRVVVTDGITIGHPCCGVAHCKEPLLSNRHRFCQTHTEEENICVVERCRNARQDGHLTCDDIGHRTMETNRNTQNKGFFQLCDRLARQRVAHPNDAFAAQSTDDVEVVERILLQNEVDPVCEEKDSSGVPRLRARFGRRRSHNEQILVRPCGMIVARKTFFGSETTPQTVEFLQETFDTPGSMPEIVIYDLGCQLYRHLNASKNNLFKTVGFPVDVFHWKSKHKKNSEECAVHCNPTNFPELISEDGVSWFFNSSVAEQTNVWLGGYHAILWEMGQTKFNFFLDEMILRKNRLIKDLIGKKGWNPGYIPDLL